MKNRFLTWLLVIVFVLAAIPALAVNVNVDGEIEYVLQTPITKKFNELKLSANSSSALNYSLSTTIDKKWTLKLGYKLDFNPKVIEVDANGIKDQIVDINSSVTKVEIKYADKNFNFEAHKNPGGSVGELGSAFNLLVFPVPWGDPNGYILRGYAKPLGVDLNYQFIKTGWYAAEMNGMYLKGTKAFGGTNVTLAARSIVDGAGNLSLYQGAIYGLVPVGKLKLEPGLGLTQRNGTKDNLAFGIKLAGPVTKDVDLDISTRVSQPNFESRYFNRNYSEQNISATWKKQLRVSGNLVGPTTDLKTRTLNLGAEWRNNPANNDFVKQFDTDKYFTNKDFGVGLNYTMEDKGANDIHPKHTVVVKGTTPIIKNKAWVLGSLSFKADKDLLENSFYVSAKRLDTSLNARAKVLPALTMETYLNYGTNPDSKVGTERVKVQSASTGIGAKYDLSNTTSVGAKIDLTSSRFGTGNTVIRTIGANWLLKTSDNASFEVAYGLGRNLLVKDPSYSTLTAKIKLKF